MASENIYRLKNIQDCSLPSIRQHFQTCQEFLKPLEPRLNASMGTMLTAPNDFDALGNLKWKENIRVKILSNFILWQNTGSVR